MHLKNNICLMFLVSMLLSGCMNNKEAFTTEPKTDTTSEKPIELPTTTLSQNMSPKDVYDFLIKKLVIGMSIDEISEIVNCTPISVSPADESSVSKNDKLFRYDILKTNDYSFMDEYGYDTIDADGLKDKKVILIMFVVVEESDVLKDYSLYYYDNNELVEFHLKANKKTPNEDVDTREQKNVQMVSPSTQGIDNSILTENLSPIPSTPENSKSSYCLTNDGEKFLGYWQLGMGIGSGYGERYAFFKDGTFWWEKSQVAASERLIARKGTWSYESNQMTFNIIDEYYLTGGKVVENPLYFDGKSIEDGIEKHIGEIDSIIHFKVSLPVMQSEYQQRYFVLDGNEYYNYDNQPDFFDEELLNGTR